MFVKRVLSITQQVWINFKNDPDFKKKMFKLPPKLTNAQVGNVAPMGAAGPVDPNQEDGFLFWVKRMIQVQVPESRASDKQARTQSVRGESEEGGSK